MPERITGKKLQTLGELRQFINGTLGDLEDDYEVSISGGAFYSVDLLGNCDISYSSQSLIIECEVTEYDIFHK